MTGSKRKKEDTFGLNDDDWNVYKQIVSSIIIRLTSLNQRPSVNNIRYACT